MSQEPSVFRYTLPIHLAIVFTAIIVSFIYDNSPWDTFVSINVGIASIIAFIDSSPEAAPVAKPAVKPEEDVPPPQPKRAHFWDRPLHMPEEPWEDINDEFAGYTGPRYAHLPQCQPTGSGPRYELSTSRRRGTLSTVSVDAVYDFKDGDSYEREPIDITVFHSGSRYRESQKQGGSVSDAVGAIDAYDTVCKADNPP
ncbi:hypothetical protein EUX98_g1132 [Antrodiella citrinella]|uniref:Uncharacterized protein n=1 Tax=Antrodiella citrinella TaxID=2447956 RepID=A0A4S4NAU5_9APHY|nr:hypothetical protein EUX98_g1132 [Antrodiella citrinella]